VRRRVIVRAICELGRGLSRKRNFFARTDFFITSFGAARRDERARVDGGGLSPSRGVDRPARCKPALARSRASRSRRRSRALEPRVARASSARARDRLDRARASRGARRVRPRRRRGGKRQRGRRRRRRRRGRRHRVDREAVREPGEVHSAASVAAARVLPSEDVAHDRRGQRDRRPRSRRADRGVGGGGRRRREDL